MSHCAPIGCHLVSSDYPYIVYGPATGLLGGGESLEEAHLLWEVNQANYRERGREADALVFRWEHGAWLLCGTLYEAGQNTSRSAAY